MSIKKPWLIVLIIALPVLALLGYLVGTKADTSTQDSASSERITVSFITHAGAGDTFWDIVRKGAEASAEKSNIDLQYASDPDGTRQAQLVQQAIDAKVDGIVVTLSKPEAMKDVVSNAQEAGIPIVAINGGTALAEELGITYFGQEDYDAGKAVGEKLKAEGIASPVCVIHEQGNVGHEARCQAIIDLLPGAKRLYVPGTDMAQTKSQITAELQTQTGADAIVGVGAPFSLTALQVVEELNKTNSVKVASFDLSADLTQAILDGKVLFTVDQQPYLQGYQSVDAIWLNKNGLFTLGGGKPVATGPAIVTKTEAARVLEFAQQGIR